MNILVTGGAGYIGSHVVLAAIDQGYKVTVIDDLSNGHEENIHSKSRFILCSLASVDELKKIFKGDNFDAIIHLAGKKASGESMLKPSLYAKENIIGSINIINTCLANGIKKLIFSSSASIYGTPKVIPINEDHPLNPTNYYGFSKMVIEQNLAWFTKLCSFKYVSLRYFNACGYDAMNRIIGVDQNPQNLIPRLMESALDKSKTMKVYGNDYSTKDGTGVRDYVHVSDLAQAHIDSLEYLNMNRNSIALNLGSDHGFSVLEIINKTKKISKKIINYKFERRRYGDIGTLISDSTKAKKVLRWENKHSNLDTIIKTTWNVYKLNSKSNYQL